MVLTRGEFSLFTLMGDSFDISITEPLSHNWGMQEPKTVSFFANGCLFIHGIASIRTIASRENKTSGRLEVMFNTSCYNIYSKKGLHID